MTSHPSRKRQVRGEGGAPAFPKKSEFLDGAADQQLKMQVPFGYAHGRLSTPLKNASLWMTIQR